MLVYASFIDRGGANRASRPRDRSRFAHGNASCECVSYHMPTSAEVCEGYGKREDDNDEERAGRR